MEAISNKHNCEMRRCEKVDFLKGVAIILMVMGHLISGIECMRIPFNFIYSFHMPLLFFLSGYLTETRKSRYMPLGVIYFIRRKALTLLVPYFSWTVLVPWVCNGFNLKVLYSQLINVTGIYGGGIWFLPVLFGLMLMYGYTWIFRGINEENIGFWKDVIILFSSVVLLGVAVVATKYPYFTNMLSYAIPFFLGIFVVRYNFVRKILCSRVVIILAIVMWLLIFPYFDFYDTNIITQVKRILLSFFAIVVLWNLCREEAYRNIFLRLILLCGRYSLAIYLMSGYFGGWKGILLNIKSVLFGMFVSFWGSIFVCVICIVGAKILEKTRFTKRLFLGQ